MYDLTVTSRTPGRPRVLVAANVTASAADKLVQRMQAQNLAADVEIVSHVQGRTVDNVNERNADHVEVLLAVLERREAQAAQVAPVRAKGR